MASTESQKKASIKYAKNNLKRIPLDVKLDEYENIKAFAESKNMSVRGLIMQAIKHEIERGQHLFFSCPCY